MTVIDNVRVLVFALNGRDALAPVGVFRKAGLPAELCTSLFELMIGLRAGAGAVVLSEEALPGQALDDLATWVARQPPWSDLPFVVLTGSEEQPATTFWRQCLVTRLRNVVLLGTPVPPATLVNIALSAVRARRCQYEVRTLLEKRRQAALVLKALAAARTSEIEAMNITLRSEIAEREHVEALLHRCQEIEAVR